ncbi:molybdate ABC transporter substrate-binding protein [Desulfurobacterium sp.]
MRVLLFILFFFCSTLSSFADVVVFAGAGMRAPLDEIGKRFEKISGIHVIYDYEGSGRLGNKILAGQIPDVFIPGSMRWANILQQRGFIDFCFPIAYHIPVLITPKKDVKVKSFEDISRKDVSVVVGDPKACAIGRVTRKIFSKSGLKEQNLNIVAYGVTVKQVLHWVENRDADAGIVWRSDAISSPMVKFLSIPDEFNVRSVIPVCILKPSENKSEVKAFVRFMKTHGSEVFKSYGFVPCGSEK